MFLSVETGREMVSRDELIKVFTEISDFEEMKAFIGEILTLQQKTCKED